MADIVLGIKLKYDGKEVDGGVTISRESLRQFAAEAKKAGDAASSGFSAADRGANALASTLGQLKTAALGYLSVTGVLAASRWATQQASDMMQLDARLKVATSSLQEYQRAQAGVFEVANRWGAAIDETARTFARLNPVVTQMGGTTATTLKMMDGLAASLRLSGASAAETSAVLLQFSQALGSGRVGGDEFRSMMENAEPLMRALAAQLGKTTGELRQMAEDGKLTSSVFGNALLPAIDKLREKASQIPLGISQAWQVLENNLKRDFGKEFTGHATTMGEAINSLSARTGDAAKAARWLSDAFVTVAGNAAIVAGGAALGAVILSVGALGTAARAAAGGVAMLNAEAMMFVTGAALQRLEKLGMASKAGLIGLALWGGYEIGTFIGNIGSIQSALGNLLEPIFRAYDKVTGDDRRKRQLAIEDAKKDLEELKRLKAGGQSAVSVDTQVLGLTSKKLVGIDQVIADAEKKASDLEKAWAQIYNAPVAAAAKTGDQTKLSSAGQYGKLTESLKWEEKLRKDHAQALLDLQTSYADKYRITDQKDQEALSRNHAAALKAMLEQQKAELEALPGAKEGKARADAAADAQIAAWKTAVKRIDDVLKQEYEHYRLSTSDYLAGVQVAQQAAILHEIDAVQAKLRAANKESEKIPLREKLAELQAQLAQLPISTAAALEDAQAKANDVLAKMAVAAGKTLDPVEEAGRKFVAEWGKEMQRAAADGNAAVMAAGEAVRKAMLDQAQFESVKQQFDAQLERLKGELEAVRQEADRDGGWLSGIQAAQKAEEIRARLIPQIQALRVEMERSAGTSLVNQKATESAKREVQKLSNEVDPIWKKTVDGFDSDFRKGFRDMIEKRGKPMWKSFTESLAATFKTTVADAIYQFFARPFIFQAVASVAGMVGATGLANAASTAGGAASAAGAGGWLSVGSNLSTGWSTFTGGLSSTYNAAASSSIGQWAGLSNGVSGASAGASVYEATYAQALMTGATEAEAVAAGKAAAASSLTSTGTMVGTGLSYAGAGLAGIGIGSAIAGDKQIVGLDGTTISAIGAAIGSIWGPVGTFVGGVVGGIVDAAFGMGDKQAGTTTLAGQFSGAGFSGSYQTPWHQDGGWFRSDRNGVDITALADTQTKALSTLVVGTKSVYDNLTKAAGESEKSITGWTFSINQQVATAEQQKQLTIDMATSMGNYLIPNLKDFGKEGENLADTAVRMGDEFVLTNKIAVLAGKDISTAFGSLGLASMAARDNLVTLMGGIQQMTASTQSYYQAFFTDSERHANDLKALGEQFKGLGLNTMPATREAFRALVEQQNLGTESGRQMYAALMTMNQAFAAVIPASSAVAAAVSDAANTLQLSAATLSANADIQAQIDELTGTANAVRTRDRAKQIAAAEDATTQALLRQLYAQQDLKDAADAATEAQSRAQQALKEAADAATEAQSRAQQMYDDALGKVSSAQNDLLSAYQREADIKRQLVSQWQSYAASLRNFSKSLAAGEFSVLSPEQKYAAAQAQFQDVSTRARLGDKDAVEQLQSVSEQFLTASREYNASTAQYAADYAKVQAALKATADVADRQADIAERQLSELTQQVSLLVDLNANVVSVAQAISNLASAQTAAAAAARSVSTANTAATAASVAATPGAVAVTNLPSNPNAGLVILPTDSAMLKAQKVLYQSMIGGVDSALYNQYVGAVGGSGKVAGNVGDPAALRKIAGFSGGGIADGLFQAGEQGTELMYSADPVRVLSHSQSKAAVIDGDQVSQLLSDLVAAVHALIRQGGSVGTAMIEGQNSVGEKIDALKRKLARAA